MNDELYQVSVDFYCGDFMNGIVYIPHTMWKKAKNEVNTGLRWCQSDSESMVFDYTKRSISTALFGEVVDDYDKKITLILMKKI